MKEIEQIFDFIVEVDKLKGVHRKTRPVGLARYENSAEHSWHVCLTALMLKEYADETIDIDRVIKMLLIHDIGEIDAGDTIIYCGETDQIKEEEEAGLRRVFDLLPPGRAEEFIQLWLEFEAGETPDAKYAKAIDRIPPLLQNLNGHGHSWRENQVSEQQILTLNSRISRGSSRVWSVLKTKLNSAFRDGILGEA